MNELNGNIPQQPTVPKMPETQEEKARRLCRENYAEQMETLGYNADGDPIAQKVKKAAKYAPEMVTEQPAGFVPLPWDDPFRPAITIKVAGVDDMTKELERIRKELHSLNEIMKRRKP